MKLYTASRIAFDAQKVEFYNIVELGFWRGKCCATALQRVYAASEEMQVSRNSVAACVRSTRRAASVVQQCCSVCTQRQRRGQCRSTVLQGVYAAPEERKLSRKGVAAQRVYGAPEERQVSCNSVAACVCRVRGDASVAQQCCIAGMASIMTLSNPMRGVSFFTLGDPEVCDVNFLGGIRCLNAGDCLMADGLISPPLNLSNSYIFKEDTSSFH